MMSVIPSTTKPSRRSRTIRRTARLPRSGAGTFQCFRMVKRLQAGIVWVNHMQPTYVEAPWGGYKMSGIGRELGPWGAEEYLQVKQVHINLSEAPLRWY